MNNTTYAPQTLMELEAREAPNIVANQIQSFYLFVEQLARLRGYNPDKPQHLKKVTETR